MKTIILIIITAFICAVIVLLFWATKNWIRETNAEKMENKKEYDKSLEPPTEKNRKRVV